MLSVLTRAVAAASAALTVVSTPSAQRTADVLQPVFALPAHVINRFEQPSMFAATTTGEYLVLDRRAHAVFRLDAAGGNATPIVTVRPEAGRLLRPIAMALSDEDILAVLDAPGTYQRLQYFTARGTLVGLFYLRGLGVPALTLENQVIAGAGTMAFDGRAFWFNVPAWGAPLSEVDTAGSVRRHIGTLRPTGHEGTADLHEALNTGVPVVDPTGGLFFVFQNGRPMLRKYAESGTLLFERHIEGPELDPIIHRLPTRWPARGDGSRPLPAPVVRTASADRQGRLWVVLLTGHVYVYNASGEKVRTLTFGGATPTLTSSLFFRRNGRVLTGPGGYEFETPK